MFVRFVVVLIATSPAQAFCQSQLQSLPSEVFNLLDGAAARDRNPAGSVNFQPNMDPNMREGVESPHSYQAEIYLENSGSKSSSKSEK